MGDVEDDSDRAFLTYSEYAAHCHLNGKKPLPRSAVGNILFSLSYDSPETVGSLDRVFDSLAGEDGTIRREDVVRMASRLHLPADRLVLLFDSLGAGSADSISRDAFMALFSSQQAC